MKQLISSKIETTNGYSLVPTTESLLAQNVKAQRSTMDYFDTIMVGKKQNLLSSALYSD